MKTPTTSQSIELRFLRRDYQSMRSRSDRTLSGLIESMRRQGQLVPVITVQQDNEWLLLDGYRRVAAAMTLGQDTILAEVWVASIDEGLLRLLAQKNQRTWSAIEEAHLLRELQEVHGYSLRALSERIGRDVSWVSRRLSLLTDMPEIVLTALMSQQIDQWAATRILAPLARANTEHATSLLNFLNKNPCSSRWLKLFFEEYQNSSAKKQREMATHPDWYLKSKQMDEIKLPQSAEKKWLEQLQSITTQIIEQQQTLLPCFEFDIDFLTTAFNSTKKHFLLLEAKLQEITHARTTTASTHSSFEPARQISQGNRAATESL